MQSEKYNFDSNGNRKAAEIQGQKQNYKTGEYNRLLSDENYSYEYDHEGNRISKTDKEGNVIKYLWDNRNRLIKVITPTDKIEYLYDYLNRLVKRTENKTDNQYFVHDNWQIILQFNNKDSQPTHRYLWGTKQDELICNNNNWTLSDHLNTIRDIVKSDGKVENHINYNAFGKITSKTKNDNISFAYTGKLFDQANDLQWNINRWYDSDIGKWVSEDPIGFYGHDKNLYRYVDNSSLSFTDILGLWKINRVFFKPIVDAYAEQGDTFASLATMIGLSISQKEKWLTLYNNEVLGAYPKCGNKYGIPNVMLRVWFGEVSRLGKFAMQWETNQTRLNKIGFYVETFDNDDYFWQTGSNVTSIFTDLLKQLASDKKLHGIYFMGHGSDEAIGSIGTLVYTHGPRWRINYNVIGTSIGYLLGALIIQACESNNTNARNLVAANGIFQGYDGIYFPMPFNIAKFWGATNGHPFFGGTNAKIKPFTLYGGEQATSQFWELHKITNH
jgi:RHS repeat-associated protein